MPIWNAPGIAERTFVIGVDFQPGDEITFTIGYARTFARAVTPEVTDVWIVNPNPLGGDSGPAALGRHDRATDSFGAAIEVAW